MNTGPMTGGHDSQTQPSPIHIGIIGSGFIGGELGRLWAAAGHQVTFGSRDPDSDKMRALGQIPGAAVASNAETVARAQVLLLALPGKAIAEGLAGLDLAGKVVIDAMNAFGESATQQVLNLHPHARIVKAFNTVGGENYAAPVRAGIQASMPYAGDDVEAKTLAAQLIADLGFEAVDVWPLAMAATLEQLAAVWVQLAWLGKPGRLGRHLTWKLLTSPGDG